jgi:hypothetical protein
VTGESRVGSIVSYREVTILSFLLGRNAKTRWGEPAGLERCGHVAVTFLVEAVSWTRKVANFHIVNFAGSSLVRGAEVLASKQANTPVNRQRRESLLSAFCLQRWFSRGLRRPGCSRTPKATHRFWR